MGPQALKSIGQDLTNQDPIRCETRSLLSSSGSTASTAALSTAYDPYSSQRAVRAFNSVRSVASGGASACNTLSAIGPHGVTAIGDFRRIIFKAPRVDRPCLSAFSCCGNQCPDGLSLIELEDAIPFNGDLAASILNSYSTTCALGDDSIKFEIVTLQWAKGCLHSFEECGPMGEVLECPLTTALLCAQVGCGLVVFAVHVDVAPAGRQDTGAVHVSRILRIDSTMLVTPTLSPSLIQKDEVQRDHDAEDIFEDDDSLLYCDEKPKTVRGEDSSKKQQSISTTNEAGTSALSFDVAIVGYHWLNHRNMVIVTNIGIHILDILSMLSPAIYGVTHPVLLPELINKCSPLVFPIFPSQTLVFFKGNAAQPTPCAYLRPLSSCLTDGSLGVSTCLKDGSGSKLHAEGRVQLLLVTACGDLRANTAESDVPIVHIYSILGARKKTENAWRPLKWSAAYCGGFGSLCENNQNSDSAVHSQVGSEKVLNFYPSAMHSILLRHYSKEALYSSRVVKVAEINANYTYTDLLVCAAGCTRTLLLRVRVELSPDIFCPLIRSRSYEIPIVRYCAVAVWVGLTGTEYHRFIAARISPSENASDDLSTRTREDARVCRQHAQDLTPFDIIPFDDLSISANNIAESVVQTELSDHVSDFVAATINVCTCDNTAKLLASSYLICGPTLVSAISLKTSSAPRYSEFIARTDPNKTLAELCAGPVDIDCWATSAVVMESSSALPFAGTTVEKRAERSAHGYVLSTRPLYVANDILTRVTAGNREAGSSDAEGRLVCASHQIAHYCKLVAIMQVTPGVFSPRAPTTLCNDYRSWFPSIALGIDSLLCILSIDRNRMFSESRMLEIPLWTRVAAEHSNSAFSTIPNPVSLLAVDKEGTPTQFQISALLVLGALLKHTKSTHEYKEERSNLLHEELYNTYNAVMTSLTLSAQAQLAADISSALSRVVLQTPDTLQTPAMEILNRIAPTVDETLLAGVLSRSFYNASLIVSKENTDTPCPLTFSRRFLQHLVEENSAIRQRERTKERTVVSLLPLILHNYYLYGTIDGIYEENLQLSRPGYPTRYQKEKTKANLVHSLFSKFPMTSLISPSSLSVPGPNLFSCINKLSTAELPAWHSQLVVILWLLLRHSSSTATRITPADVVFELLLSRAVCTLIDINSERSLGGTLVVADSTISDTREEISIAVLRAYIDNGSRALAKKAMAPRWPFNTLDRSGPSIMKLEEDCRIRRGVRSAECHFQVSVDRQDAENTVVLSATSADGSIFLIDAATMTPIGIGEEEESIVTCLFGCKQVFAQPLKGSFSKRTVLYPCCPLCLGKLSRL